MKKANTRSTEGSTETEGGRAVPVARDSGAAAKPALAPGAFAEEQPALFEQAIVQFHRGDFAKARAIFERAAIGANREVAHSARLHARMCEQRLASAADAIRTPEDHYNYAIALINERRLDLAEYHLQQALTQSPRGDHLYYALALSRALNGDLEGAYAYLRRAIELNHANRIAARNDPDFADFVQQQPLAELFRPEKGQPGRE